MRWTFYFRCDYKCIPRNKGVIAIKYVARIIKECVYNKYSMGDK